MYKGEELFNKKLELLSKIGEVHTSKSGNYYVILNESSTVNRFTVTTNSVTKNTLDQLGQTKEWESKNQTILLLTKKSLLIKYEDTTHFKKLSIRLIRTLTNVFVNKENIARLYFFNKKCEWMWQYPLYWSNYSFVKSFSSLKELKNYLGFTFLSTKDFYTKVNLDNAIDFYNLVSNKSSLVNVTRNNLVIDTANMMRQLNIKIKNLPRNIRSYHDKLVFDVKITKVNTTVFDFPFYDNIRKCFESLDLQYRILNSQVDLLTETKLMGHCVGSSDIYFKRLQSGLYAYINVLFKGKYYTLEIDKNGDIKQAQGKYNSSEGVSELKGLFNMSNHIWPANKETNREDFYTINNNYEERRLF